MTLRNLFFMLTFISMYTANIQTSYNPKWGKSNLSTAIDPIQTITLSKNPAGQSDSKTPKLEIIELPLPPVKKIIALPPVKVVGFIAGDRDLYTESGRSAFNQFILEKILRSSENHEEFFDTEMVHLEDQAKKNINHVLSGEIKTIQKAAKDKNLRWEPAHIFTATIKIHPTGKYPILNGFHHDHLQTVEKSKVFEFHNKEEHDHGFYCANIAIDPSNPASQFRKTFFPAHWTRKQVLGCILSSMKNVTSKPEIRDNGIATEYKFTTPIKYKEEEGKKTEILKTPLTLGFRVFANTSITSMPTVFPELPSK